jgi:hypothetical protein
MQYLNPERYAVLKDAEVVKLKEVVTDEKAVSTVVFTVPRFSAETGAKIAEVEVQAHTDEQLDLMEKRHQAAIDSIRALRTDQEKAIAAAGKPVEPIKEG